MKNYEVRLSRPITQQVHVTVSVSAETEKAAIQKAIASARADCVEWTGDLTDPAEYGEITVESVEAIVDLEETI